MELMEKEILQGLSRPSFFHVSRNLYEVGQEIAPSNYQNWLTTDKRKIENELEALRPKDKPSRANSVFAFVQLSDAYYYLKQHGGYLYEVTIDKSKLAPYPKDSHVGNMSIVELLMETSESNRRVEWIQKYWSGDICTLYKPCIEVLIDKACVKRVLIGNKRQPDLMTQCFHMYMVEYSNEYIQLLNTIASK